MGEHHTEIHTGEGMLGPAAGRFLAVCVKLTLQDCTRAQLSHSTLPEASLLQMQHVARQLFLHAHAHTHKNTYEQTHTHMHTHTHTQTHMHTHTNTHTHTHAHTQTHTHTPSQTNTHAHTHTYKRTQVGGLRSNLWPGAYVSGKDKQCASMYVGWGIKNAPFVPLPPPDIAQEFDQVGGPLLRLLLVNAFCSSYVLFRVFCSSYTLFCSSYWTHTHTLVVDSPLLHVVNDCAFAWACEVPP